MDVAAPLRFIRHACPLPLPNASSVELSTRVAFIYPRAWGQFKTGPSGMCGLCNVSLRCQLILLYSTPECLRAS